MFQTFKDWVQHALEARQIPLNYGPYTDEVDSHILVDQNIP